MGFVKVERRNSRQQRKNLNHGMKPADGLAMVRAIEQGIIGSGNYRKVWSRNQSVWKPLDPDYLEEKTKRGFSTQKWVLTGATMRSLVTVASITGRVTRNGARTIFILQNHGYFVEVDWKMGFPSASGWPGEQVASESYFYLNNRRRPWLDQVTPEAIAATYRLLERVAQDFLRRALGDSYGRSKP